MVSEDSSSYSTHHFDAYPEPLPPNIRPGPDPDRHLIDLLGSSHGLSLSLGSVQMNSGCTMGFEYCNSDWSSYGPESIAVSKYLQPARALLEEMVSLCGIEKNNQRYSEKLCRNGYFSLSSKIKAEICYVNLLKLIALLQEEY